jgi:hypothetical protein
MALDAGQTAPRDAFASLHLAYERGDDSALDKADDLVTDDLITPDDVALAYADVALRFERGEGVPADVDKRNEYVFMALKTGAFDVLLKHPIAARLNLRALVEAEPFASTDD